MLGGVEGGEGPALTAWEGIAGGHAAGVALCAVGCALCGAVGVGDVVDLVGVTLGVCSESVVGCGTAVR